MRLLEKVDEAVEDFPALLGEAGQPGYLVVPLVLDVLGVAGTLVFTRLLAPRP